MRLLIADDEGELASALCKYLELQNYMVDVCDNGNDALKKVREDVYEAIVLDIMMPGLDGLTVLRTMREEHIETPVLLLSAKGELEDRIRGLDMGADDYLPKPFSMKELVARVKAITRRKTVLMGEKLYFAGMKLNSELAQLEYNGVVEHLSSREYQIMEMFLRNPDSLVSGESLLKKIWGTDSDADMNIVCVYITYLRRKLKKLEAPIKIQSVRGIGYRLVHAES